MLAANRAFSFKEVAEGVDVATDEGLQVVAERAGLFWPELEKALKDDRWKERAKANREALNDAELWGVPVLKIGDLAVWGQDRDWLMARKIEDLCQQGEGIVV